MNRTCKHCRENKPIDSFYLKPVRSGNRVYHHVCKLCHNRRTVEYGRTDKGKKATRRADLRQYGLTIEQYDDWLDYQNGVCAVCSCEETSRTKSGDVKSLAVDHDHKSGEVRGLLCQACNIALGLLNDDVSVLQSAINYLRLSRENTVDCRVDDRGSGNLIIDRQSTVN